MTRLRLSPELGDPRAYCIASRNSKCYACGRRRVRGSGLSGANRRVVVIGSTSETQLQLVVRRSRSIAHVGVLYGKHQAYFCYRLILNSVSRHLCV